MTTNLRVTVRSLARSPAFSTIAIGTLAILICGVTLIVSLIEGAVLNPGPYRDAERLVAVRVEGAAGSPVQRVFSYDDYISLRSSLGREDAVIEGLVGRAAGSLFSFLLTGAGDPTWLRGAHVTGHVFPMLGVPPLLGRGLMADDERPGAEPVVVLHEAVWRTHFGADPQVVGRVITLNNRRHVIVGVMPRAFAWGALDAWSPLRPDLYFADAPTPDVAITGKLRAGVTEELARERLTRLFTGLAAERPGRYPNDLRVRLDFQESPAVRGGRGDLASTLTMLLGAVAILVLAGCLNVAALLLARATVRTSDLAVRVSLGAGRWTVLWGQLIEVAVLTLAATAIGIWLARTLLPAMIAAIPEGSLPNDAEITLNWRVLAMTAVAGGIATFLCALIPAWPVARADLEPLLRQGARGAVGVGGRARLWQTFVVVEVSVAMVLLVLTGIVGQRLWTLRTASLGWEPARVLTMGVALDATRYPTTDPARRVQFLRQVLVRYRELPGVVSASLGGTPSAGGGGQRFRLSGRVVRDDDRAGMNLVGADYLATYRIPVRQGREITRDDEAAARPVAVVNDAFVNMFLEDDTPIGRTIELVTSPRVSGPGPPATAAAYEIVGVAGNTTSPGGSASPQIYIPFTAATLPQRGSSFFDVRTTADDPRQMLRTLQESLWSIDPRQPFGYIRTANEVLMLFSFSWSQFQAFMFGTLCVIALLLAAGGVYGIVSFRMSRDVRNIGIRRALGATDREITRHAFSRGVQPVLVGAGLGGVLAFAAGQVAGSQLAGVTAPGVLVYALAFSVLLGAAVLACYLPARRATRVDPIVVLRAE